MLGKANCYLNQIAFWCSIWGATGSYLCSSWWKASLYYIDVHYCNIDFSSLLIYLILGNPPCYQNGPYTRYLGYCFVQKIKRLVALGNSLYCFLINVDSIEQKKKRDQWGGDLAIANIILRWLWCLCRLQMGNFPWLLHMGEQICIPGYSWIKCF
jgi:hypothetical protein